MSLVDALLLDPYRIITWIAYRTDGVNGSGTQNDPYDGSTATKFDAIMNSLSANTAVHLGPATSANPFTTAGFWTTSDGSTGSGWQAKAGMRIVGSGIDVTTLKLTGATDPSGSLTRHYFAIGHALSSTTMDYFDVSDLTIDCNLAQTGTKFACGAVRVMGNHARTRRIKAIKWGTKTSGPACFVIAMITADPSSGVNGVTDTGIEDCIAITPDGGNVGPATVFHAGPKDDSGANAEGFGTGPLIRNCFVDCDSPTATPEYRGLSMAWCKAGIVEGNQVHNTKHGGPYINKASSRDLIVLNNFYKNVFKGPYWNLGTLAPTYTGTLTLARVGTVATVTVTGGHNLTKGERVKIVGSPNNFDGIHQVTSISGNTFTFDTSVTAVSSSTLSSVQKVFGVDKLVVEGNTVELATQTTGELIGIHVHDNGLTGQDSVYPAYPYGDAVIRDNKIRYLDGAFQASPAYIGYGIQVNGAKNLLVSNNVVEAVPANPIRNNRCGSVKYFNDKTPAGTLIQGINEGNSNKKYDELETDAEDALVLALMKKR
jgi:hypothetical protein